MASKLMTTDEVAEYLGGKTTRRTLEDWRRLGTGPDYITLSSKMVRYRLSAVERWLDSCERKCSAGQIA